MWRQRRMLALSDAIQITVIGLVHTCVVTPAFAAGVLLTILCEEGRVLWKGQLFGLLAEESVSGSDHFGLGQVLEVFELVLIFFVHL
mmetsp:Transcript_39373/g.51533  ORF Transcript_39373/g.51533 Transcript_39373/m.51533 type:complete len:87 (-) Transcript_39373:170-430(-)